MQNILQIREISLWWKRIMVWLRETFYIRTCVLVERKFIMVGNMEISLPKNEYLEKIIVIHDNDDDGGDA